MCSHQSPIEDIYGANIEHVDKNDECYTRFVRSLFSFKNISINLSSTFFKNLKIWFQLLIPIKKNTRIARFEITRTPINFTTNILFVVFINHAPRITSGTFTCNWFVYFVITSSRYVFPPFSMKGYSCRVVGHLRSRTDPATLNVWSSSTIAMQLIDTWETCCIHLNRGFLN